MAHLNGLTHDEAVTLDATPQCSLAGAADRKEGASKEFSFDEEERLLTICRWLDVQAARRRIHMGREALAISQLAAQGHTQEEIGKLLGIAQQTVSRRMKASIRDLLAELNRGAVVAPDVTSHIDLCLTCGRQPRVRLVATRRRVRGGWKEVLPARQASVCEECLRSDLISRIEQPRSAVA